MRISRWFQNGRYTQVWCPDVVSSYVVIQICDVVRAVVGEKEERKIPRTMPDPLENEQHHAIIISQAAEMLPAGKRRKEGAMKSGDGPGPRSTSLNPVRHP